MPSTVVDAPPVNVPYVTDVISGKFWKSFGPVSPSPASLIVTPFSPRSMPRPLLE